MESLKDKLVRSEFRFNKSYGQNFISDTNLLNAIVADANVSPCDVVVEIGAGAGTLTEAIAKSAGKVIAYEIDRNLTEILKERLSPYENTTVIFEDFLKADKSFLSDLAGFKVVANLPYYITTPIIMELLEGYPNMTELSVMVQKEVGVRFSAKADTEDYGGITVMIDYFGDCKVTRNVNRNMFYPVPNVDSVIVKISRRSKYAVDDFNTFSRTVKAAFAMRRKTLVNNLGAAFALDKTACGEIFAKLGIDIKARGETLSTTMFAKLSNEIFKALKSVK